MVFGCARAFDGGATQPAFTRVYERGYLNVQRDLPEAALWYRAAAAVAIERSASPATNARDISSRSASVSARLEWPTKHKKSLSPSPSGVGTRLCSSFGEEPRVMSVCRLPHRVTAQLSTGKVDESGDN
jgi:hypothetical protein